jgi:hypothetical protein
MKHTKNFLCFLVLSSFAITTSQAQSANPASGGNATGTGGSVSYTIGQVAYTTNTGSNGSVSQGVQQPYEISVVTAIENARDISLECLVFPNPTRGEVKLVIRTKDFENLRFQLYNMNGIRLQDKKIDNEETEIIMDSLSPSTYFLKVLSGNKEIKTFKIIKN